LPYFYCHPNPDRLLTYRKYIIAHKLLEVLVAKEAVSCTAGAKHQIPTPADPPCVYNVFNRIYPQYSPNQVLKAMDLLQARQHIAVEVNEGGHAFIPFGYTADGLAAYRQGYYEAVILKRTVTISTAIFIATTCIALGLLEWAAL
jgi:hypothetical protein